MGGGGDLRTLAVAYDLRGQRTRPFAEAVDLVTENAFTDFPIPLPRTCQWLLAAFRRLGMSPVVRHHWWKQVLGANVSDPGIDEHLFLSELMEYCLTYDQLNAADLAIMEAISRRYQYWEERYSEKLRTHSDGGGNAGYAQERHLFLGGARTQGYALVCPALSEHVATELEKEAKILKERRKGREERQLAQEGECAQQDPKGKGKNKNH